MKTLVIISALLFASGFVYSQEEIEEEPVVQPSLTPPPPEMANPVLVSEPENGIYRIVDEVAIFRGGKDALPKFLAQNLNYPQIAIEEGIQGKCFIRFVIDKKGKISNVEVLKGVTNCPECDAEAVRVVSKMPKWKPAKVNGKKVDSYFNLPITFKLQ